MRADALNNQECLDSDDVRARRTANGYVSPAKRSASPGRALQDVKLMLSEYTRRKGVEREGDRDSPGEPPCAAPRTSTLDHLVNDTGSDIADVESRLNALQNFIRMARISADPGSGGQ